MRRKAIRPLVGLKEDDTPLINITISIARNDNDLINKLIEQGVWRSRSEAFRQILSEFLPEKLLEVKLVKDYLHLEVQEDDEFIRIPNGDGTYEELRKIGEA